VTRAAKRGHRASTGSLSFCIAWLAIFCPAITGQRNSHFGAIVEGTLTIGVPGKPIQVLRRSDVAKLPHQHLKVRDNGKFSVYAGVLLKDLLESTGLDFSDECQDSMLASYVAVEAVDANHVLFALAELDRTLTDKRVLLADSKDRKPMSPPEGPFRIIVSDEKRPVRWVRQVWAVYVAETLLRIGPTGCKVDPPAVGRQSYR
jgi:hypothetical protein